MARRHDQSDEEFREEIEAHVALETDRLIADGVSPEQAAITARRMFGNITRVRERYYESKRWMWLDDLRQDARFAFRSLRRSPVFMAVAVLTLAIGLGANTAIFTIVNAVLVRPLPYSDPQQLILIEHPPLGGSPSWLAGAWRARAHTLADFAGFEPSSPATIVTENEPLQVQVAHVSSNFFRFLGVTTGFGRPFSPVDAQAADPRVAVLSHSFWTRRFGGSPNVLGNTIEVTDVAITGEPFVIIGVLRPDFRFPIPDPPDQAPLFPRMQPDAILLSGSDAWQQVLGRLSPGNTAATASSELTAIFKQQASTRYSADLVERARVVATPLQPRLTGDTRHRLLLLMGAVGCVLLVVCANVANLLLARVTGRQAEFAIRAALGARTGRLIRMILTESLLLAAIAAAAALLFASWGNGVLRSMLAGRVSHVDAAPIDGWVLAFNIILATATGVLSAMASLIQIRSKEFIGVSHQGGRSITGRTRLRQALLAIEVAVVLVLVSTTALLCQTLWNLYHSKRGFEGDRVVIAGVMPGMSGTIPELQTRALTFFDRVVDQIGRVPGVESVAAASTVPFSGPTIGMTGISIAGRPLERGGGASVSVAVVTPGYFTTMRNTVLAGRDFSPEDRSDREHVAVVNEAFVRALASALPLVGTQLRFGRSQLTVIGIVEDTPDTSLRQPARPFIYVPLAQTIGGSFVFGRLTILVRARAGDPAALIPGVRAAVWALGHEIVIDEATTMDERLAAAVRTERNSALLFALLAGIALCVAVAGVYGVVAYSVSQRTREIGIRIALGARHRQVVGHIVWELVWPLTIGIGTGLAAAVGATHAVASVLFEIQPTDALTYAATVLVVSSTALIAGWIPARHAARIDPVTALRAE